jgi:hypothetical protein
VTGRLALAIALVALGGERLTGEASNEKVRLLVGELALAVVDDAIARCQVAAGRLLDVVEMVPRLRAIVPPEVLSCHFRV